MPNWAEGTLRLRGKPQDIIRFLREGVEAVGTKNMETITFEPVITWDEDDDYLMMSFPDAMKRLNWDSFYIKGTRRNFFDSLEQDLDRNMSEETLIIDSFRAAWDVCPEPYLEIARKYHLKIRIVTYESGMQFKQDVEIDVEGNLVRNEKITYDDWLWEADFPNMGG
jgi:hypothetical protein